MCETCGFSTHTKSAMIRHNLSHTGEKPHVCDMCGSAYADKKRLRDHKSSQHTETQGYMSSIQTFTCDFCGFSSRRKDNLRAHIRRVHPDLSVQHITNTEIRSNQQETLPLSSINVQSLSRPSNLNIVLNPVIDATKTEESKPEIRLVNSAILTSPNKNEQSLIMDPNCKININNKAAKNHPDNISSSTRLLRDRSHIVGHINQDGSIIPVASATPSHPTLVLDDTSGIDKDLKVSELQQLSNGIRTNDNIALKTKGERPVNLDFEQTYSTSEVVQSYIPSKDT